MMLPKTTMDMPAADTMGRTSAGQEALMMTRAPFVRPEAPAPETVRPALIWSLDCARAAIRLPTSKTRKKATNVYWICQRRYEDRGVPYL